MNKYVIQDRLFDIGLLGRQGEQYATILTSRGCPFGCIFCSSYELFEGRWRGRSPENVVEEIKILNQKFDKKIIDIIDDTFTFDKSRAIRILKLIIAEGLNISLIVTTRVDLFDSDIAKYLKKAGGKTVFFGIESGNQETLDYLQKGFTIQTVEKAVKIAKKAGLLVAGSFIIGNPGETKEMINNTISFARKLDLDSARFPLLIPFPGTKIYQTLKKDGLLTSNNLKDYKYSTSLIENPNINFNKLKKLQFKAGLYTNVKPLILGRMIKGCISK